MPAPSDISLVKKIAALMLLALTACGSEEPAFEPPPSVFSGSLERVDRPREREFLAPAEAMLTEMGLVEPISAAYDFLPKKPIFFTAAGKVGPAGTQRPEAERLLLAALPHFAGEHGPRETPRGVKVNGEPFVCAVYDHTGVPGTVGTGGLASLSAICAWSGERTAGVGVGVAGALLEDTAKHTAEVRRTLEAALS